MNHNYELIYFVKKYADQSWKLNDPAILFCDMTFILEGEAVYSSGGQEYRVKAGEGIFLPMGSDRHTQTKGMQCVAFNFKAEASPFSEVTRFSWHQDLLLGDYFNIFQRAWNTKTEIDRMKCDGLFLLVLSRVLELLQEKQSNPYVLQMKAYLHEHYSEKITVQMIAHHVQLNPVYCGALFAKETGDTILNYANQLRVVKAKELLQCTTDPVSQIAAEVGVEDLYYFSRMFKKIVGVSPQQYRLGKL